MDNRNWIIDSTLCLVAGEINLPMCQRRVMVINDFSELNGKKGNECDACFLWGRKKLVIRLSMTC